MNKWQAAALMSGGIIIGAVGISVFAWTLAVRWDQKLWRG